MTSRAFSTDAWVTSRRTVARMSWAGQQRPECRGLQVESTPTGQNVMVFMDENDETGGAWQKLTIVLPDGATVEVRGSDFYHVDVRRPDGSFIGYVSTEPEAGSDDA